ncbi:MAG: sulfite oxidase [Candidatus Dormibacteraeota bacterium]|nr:sulfite oxidase [Candidatus Dormibacteraeota bacterium]
MATEARPQAPVTASSSPDVTLEELQLAARNHSMPLEALQYPITPIGLHYLLTHFDIPLVDPASWRLTIGGRVRDPVSLTLDNIKERPAVTRAVTLECAGNGRARLSPRPLSQPWLFEAVGTAEWTGTALRPLLEAAGPLDDAVEVVFAGLDRGVQGGVEQQYERSLPLAEALREEVFLAYAINGQQLPPQHGFPVRLVVPGWYGMTHVKWLRSITVVNHPFRGYQQEPAYHVTPSDHELGKPVTRMLPRALMVPPGIPDFLSRTRLVDLGRWTIEGRSWSGRGPVVRVELSVDGGHAWADAELGTDVGQFSWRAWRYRWDAVREGEYELCCRATDAAGNVQPLTPPWNAQGMCNNEVQRIMVRAGRGLVPVQPPVDGIS